MSILSQILGCSIKDLIEDDPAIINYEKVAEECKDDPLYSLNQVFSPKNTEYLRKLLLQVGVACNISSYSWYRTVSIKNDYELSSIQVDFNIRVSEVENTSVLQVVDFYICVNQALLNEAVIKGAFIEVLETYARKLKFNEIHFIISKNFERRNNQFSNSNSDLPADFNYTLGTESTLFTQKDFKCSSHPEFKKYHIEWRKTLS